MRKTIKTVWFSRRGRHNTYGFFSIIDWFWFWFRFWFWFWFLPSETPSGDTEGHLEWINEKISIEENGNKTITISPFPTTTVSNHVRFKPSPNPPSTRYTAVKPISYRETKSKPSPKSWRNHPHISSPYNRYQRLQEVNDEDCRREKNRLFVLLLKSLSSPHYSHFEDRNAQTRGIGATGV